MSGVTQIPTGGYIASAEFTPMEASAVTESTAVETSRPVEPVGDADTRQFVLSRTFMIHAMAFSAIASMVAGQLSPSGEQETSGSNGGTRTTPVAPRLDSAPLLDLSSRFLAALAASRAGAASSDSRDALFEVPAPSPNSYPAAPADVAGLGHLLRRQILQDYRVAFMVHGRLTVSVAQLLL